MIDSISFYQHYWWFIISLLASLLVFLLFVQGGQTLVRELGRTDTERSMIISSLGRKWELTFTTLVVFGGAFFASFPLFYSTSFGGAYWLWMTMLFSFILQAVSYEFRSRKGNLLGTGVYDMFLYINGFVGTFLLGVAIASFFTGNDFCINRNNIMQQNAPVISVWQNPLHGLESIISPFNAIAGFTVFFLSRIEASLYFAANIGSPAIRSRINTQLYRDGLPFLLFFIMFVVAVFTKDGCRTDPYSGVQTLEKFRYLKNMLEMPWNLCLFSFGTVSVILSVILTLSVPRFKRGIWLCGAGTLAVVLSLMFAAGYNNTPYYPSSADIQSSLTIYNSSSSLFTLKVMSAVSLLIPVVAAYIFAAWKAMDKNPITEQEIKQGEDGY